MTTHQQLREMSRILTQHGKDLRDFAERARERSSKLRDSAVRAKLSGDDNKANAKAARERQDRDPQA
jgi:hypothetical protein